MSMGDTWQVFARELRGWGAEQCGLFGSLSGLGHSFAALHTRRSVRRLGTRGHTLLATGSVAVTDLALGIGSTQVVFASLVPNWIGRTQGVALSARMTAVGGAMGIGQGALAGDRQNLHALLKVLGPTMYSYIFAFGCKIGWPSLPFLFAAAMATLAECVILLTSPAVWKGVPPESAAGAASTLPTMPNARHSPTTKAA